MKPLAFTSILLLTCVIPHAQVIDNFSNPVIDDQWHGDLEHFLINEEEMLQLSSPESGTSLIYSEIGDGPVGHWSLDLYLDFDPSPSNLVRIYLSLSDPDLSSASGYFLQLGSTGDEDKIQLYQMSPGDEKMIAEGISPFGTSPRLQVELNIEDDVLTLMSIVGDGAPIQEMKLSSPFVDSVQQYFGILCQYTESRKDKFFFDNIEVSDIPRKDDIPPEILRVEIASARQLVLHFSEAVDQPSSENVANYTITPTIGAPQQAVLLADPTMLQLDLDDSLLTGQIYTLESRNIADLVGNLHFSEIAFQHFPAIDAGLYDLVLNEIYDDPTPSRGLPDAEYIEILCRKDGINTEGMQLSIGSSSVKLPSRDLSTNDIMLIHDIQDNPLFSEFENAVGVKGLPTLVNTGNNIELRTIQGELIHQVNYEDNWHTNQKEDGGYALELINPNDGCALNQNWTSSTALSGGTPGYQNSVHSDLLFAPPLVINLSPIDPNTLELQLNKSQATKISTAEVALGPGISPRKIEVLGASRNKVMIDVEPALLRGIQYSLVLKGWKDCADQSYDSSPIPFLIPEVLSQGDLIINEILFDPVIGGHDFIEIYNPSSKALSLQDLVVTNITTSKAISFDETFLIRPETYIVLTKDALDLASRYNVTRPDWIIEADLPPLNNDSGNVTLFTTTSGKTVIIDVFDYDVGFHSALLKETEGISLERLHPQSATQSIGNWHSAAESAGYATPTGPNSQSSVRSLMAEKWDIEPNVFSPDGDGYDDYALIRYRDLDPGNYLHLKIYDSAGRLIRYLANNLSLQTTGEILWDGSTDVGRKAAVGIYTIYIQLFNSKGIVSELKETCVVAAPLK